MTDDKSRPNEERPANTYIDDEYTTRYRKDAERGDPEAQHALAMACLTNLESMDESANEAEALRWLRKAAEQNHADSQYTLGSWCELGRFTPKMMTPPSPGIARRRSKGMWIRSTSSGTCIWLDRVCRRTPSRRLRGFARQLKTTALTHN